MTNNFVNLTPHAIVLYKGGNLIATIAPTGKTLRVPEPVSHPVSNVSVNADDDDADTSVEWMFSVVRKVFAPEDKPVLMDNSGEEPTVLGPLPVAPNGTFYIVSRIAALAMPERTDLLMVDGTIRDENGRIIGCTGFAVA